MCLAAASAESPLELGLRGAVGAMTPVPEAERKAAIQETNKLLARYLKHSGQVHLVLFRPGDGETWVEMSRLQLAHISWGIVSEADRGNGIEARLSIVVDYDRHRTHVPVPSK